MPRPKRPKAAKRQPLSTELVLLAALKLADEQGLEELSMRPLAAALQVKVMSLYNHVASKDQILDGLVELVASEIELPRMDVDWREAMRRRAHSAHTALMRHPWATMLFVSRANVGPVMLRYVDSTIGCLRQAGFSYPLADHAWNAVDAYIYGFTLQKLNFPFEPAEYANAARQFLPLIPPGHLPWLRGMSEEIIAGRHDGLHSLELGLDILLEGLERLRVASKPA